MTDRIIDTAAIIAVTAFVWLVATRIGFVIGPDACWTSCR